MDILLTGNRAILKGRMKQMRASVIFHSLDELPHIGAVTGTIVKNEFPDHVHESLCLGLSIQGERVIRSCGTEITVAEGGIFLIPPKTPHSCSVGRGENHSYRIITIKPEFINQVLNDISSKNKEALVYSVSEIKDVFLKELIEDFFACLDEERDLLRISEAVYEITARLISDHASVRTEIVEPVAGEISAKKAAEFIELNWDQQIFLERLGKEAGMSPYHLLRVFRKVMGITPHSYLLHTRIKKAVEFLSNGMTLADVAAMAGFTDQSHFTKVFRKQVGVTPGLFQEINRSKIHQEPSC